MKLSATTSGINDVKEAVKVAKNELAMFKRETVMFIDEIHRFNKLQQVSVDKHAIQINNWMVINPVLCFILLIKGDLH